jgi:hypothetical protein
VLIGAQGVPHTGQGAVAIVAPGGSQAGRMGRRHMSPRPRPPWQAGHAPIFYWRPGVSANLLYGFERFILQNVQSGHVKVTFLLKGTFRLNVLFLGEVFTLS